MPLTIPKSSSSAISRGSAPVSSTTSLSEYSAPRSRSENVIRRSAAPGRASPLTPDGAGGAMSGSGRPAARPPPPRRRGLADVRLGAARGQPLPDHAQRQELVALQPQDRAQARDVV